MLPAAAAGIEREWPTVRQICRIKRWRQFKKNGNYPGSVADLMKSTR
jgi:hypothetical protein